MNYGWSLFMTALELREQQRTERLVDMAIALRMALYADKDSFDSFIRR